MNKTVLLVLTVIAATLTGGCSFFSDFSDARKELEEEANKPIPRVNASKSKTDHTEAEAAVGDEEEFADLEENAQPIQKIAGLIPATNPDTRARSRIRGRQDPFSVVTLIPKVEIEEEELAPQPVANRPSEENRNRNPIRLDLDDDDEGFSNPIDELRTKLAQEVIISGLYESNGSTKLIVQAPEENSSRYVEVGQYLSNGQVLVKSIDRNHFPTPLVILEQSGVEVAKAIGETPEDSGNQISSLPTKDLEEETLLSNVSLELVDVE